MCKVYKSTVQIVQKREKMTWQIVRYGLAVHESCTKCTDDD